MVKKTFIISTVTAIMLFSGEAFAACIVNATAAPGLGTYVSNQPVHNDSSGIITVKCVPGTLPYNIGIDYGLHYLPPYRRLMSGASFVNYDLYKDANRTQRWGTLPEELTYATSTATDQVYLIYVRVFSFQSPSPGTYTDTVTIIVIY